MKKKHLGATLITCDWTGLPISVTKYFVPIKGQDGKIKKQGHFLNWNCAAAWIWHANSLGKMTDAEKWWSMNKIEELAGQTIQLAPNFEKLAHFSTNDVQSGMTMQEYIAACNERTETIFGIYVPPDAIKLDAVEMVPLRPKAGSYDFAVATQLGCTQLVTTRLLKPNFGRDKMIVMMCDAQMQSIQPNKVAQKLSKQSVCGKCLFLIMHPGYNGNADQYESYPKEEFIQHFMKIMPVLDSMPEIAERAKKIEQVITDASKQTEEVLKPMRKKRKCAKTAEPSAAQVEVA